MRTLSDKLARLLTAITLSFALLLPQMAYSETLEENPTMLAMTGDLLIARPLLLATTIVGTAVFLVSLPFSALGGNTGQAADTLVVGPAAATFVRCLGCTQSGYKKDTVGEDR
jgi:hypothetical protein